MKASKINVCTRSLPLSPWHRLTHLPLVFAECARGEHSYSREFTGWGIFCAICLFPCGLLCLLWVCSTPLRRMCLNYYRFTPAQWPTKDVFDVEPWPPNPGTSMLEETYTWYCQKIAFPYCSPPLSFQFPPHRGNLYSLFTSITPIILKLFHAPSVLCVH